MLVRIGRRHFLKGAGGAMLAIPFLRSLTDFVEARAAVANPLKRIILIAQPHAAAQMHRCPELSFAKYGVGNASFLTVDAARGLRHGTIPTDPATMAKGFDIAALRGAGNPIREQMCVFNGMMSPGNDVHGHIDRTKCNMAFSGNIHFQERGISIDQVLHEKVYGARVPDLRSVHMGSQAELFYTDRVGTNPNHIQSPREAYNTLIRPKALAKASSSGTSAPPAPTPSGPTDDEILEESAVNALSAERQTLQARADLSSADKQLLTAYFDNLSDLEKRVGGRRGTTPVLPPEEIPFSCTAPASANIDERRFIPKQGDKPGEQHDARHAAETYGIVARLAFMCDVTRVVGVNLGGWATMMPASYDQVTRHTNGQYDDHQTIWHPIGDGLRPELHVVCADHVGLAAKIASDLHAVKTDDGSSTLLDDTLIIYASEFGAVSETWTDGHGHTDYCYVTFGGKNAINVGKYYDSLGGTRRPVGAYAWTVNNFLQTILTAYGLSKEDWEPLNGNRAGFGRFSGTSSKATWGDTTVTVAGANDAEKRAVLPLVLKGVS